MGRYCTRNSAPLVPAVNAHGLAIVEKNHPNYPKKQSDEMAIPLLICDDSSMARKQVARSLPEDWEVDIEYATNGLEGLEAIRQGKGEMVFLDLTMPQMDGYEVLEKIRDEQHKSVVIVISGDIQPEAMERVKSLGALEFIKKPINKDKLQTVLHEFGLL